MPPTILFMDNRPDILDKYGRLLEHDGYHVVRASSLEEAEDVLRRKWIHLAVLDIRMADEDDDNDISGLLLAQKPEFAPIPKIILTAHQSFEHARLMLRPGAEGWTPAVNFIAKEEGPSALRRAIGQAFANEVRINWNLEIHWDRREHLSFLHLAKIAWPDLPDRNLVYRAGELTDLIRRLFYDYSHVRIGRLLWRHDGRFCLPVLARSPQGATDSRILVCGPRDRLEQELSRLQEFAPGNVRATKLVGRAETMHFSAAAYVLPNADMETVQPLEEMFREGRERDLKRALNHLLKDVLLSWHQRGERIDEDEPLSLYRRWVGLSGHDLGLTEVEQRLENLIQTTRSLGAVEIERGDSRMVFYFPNVQPLVCPDPLATVCGSLSQYDRPTVCKVSPGRLTAFNVLVDSNRQTWLTDFSRAGQAPQWWDFVCLEAAIRFELCEAPDLVAWQYFEECLVAPISLTERLRIQDVIAGLRTNVTLIEEVRRQAASEAGPDPLPHYTGLLAWAVGAIARCDPEVFYTQAERMRGAHLLLAAAMLAHRVSAMPAGASRLGGSTLRLEEDGTVWIGDRCVDVLTGQEHVLLRCLHNRAGSVVNRRTIAESVFGEETYEAHDRHQESRINSLIRRLRSKIEPDPNRPRYVVTIRGKGYRLEVEGATG